MPDPILTTRALNRALLARQMLLERSTLGITEVMERMGGIQMQYAPAGYIGLWSRMRDFDRPMLTRALEDRSAIQATLMRATIHTVSAADYWPMEVGVRRVRREWFENVSRRQVDRLDPDRTAEAVRAELADGPLAMKELTARLVARGFPAVAAKWAGTWVDLVRVPPSGTWERRRADLYGLAESWLPMPDVTEEQGMELLVRRYLGAFGPAEPKDVASWMGMNVRQIRGVLTAIDLRELRDERGATLLDLPDAPLPHPDTPAPPRFIAVWDAMLLVHARRTEVLPEALRPLIFNTKTPHSFNTFLLDGQVAGTWRFEDGRIELSPLRELTAVERRGLDDEAERLAAFHA
ncbi:MAG TPA: winged helix DNA-binding domain-containing protein [Candidatus Limnocylindria bacterium]